MKPLNSTDSFLNLWTVFLLNLKPLSRLNRKKQVVRTCLDCGAVRRFTMNRNYLSRNEKAELEMTLCESREAIDQAGGVEVKSES